jgi:hypothetical protein
MNNKSILSIIVGLVLVLLLLTACNSTPTLTITVKGGTCTLDSPKTIPNGAFNLNFVSEDDGHKPHGFALVTLDAGKTLQDLVAWPSTDPPEWLTVLDAQETEPGTYSEAYNLPKDFSVRYNGEPIYFVCFQSNPETKIGAVGPVEVSK